jgi:hypothetical protein
MIGGLDAGRAYVVRTHDATHIEADRAGEARVGLRLDGRTELLIHPAA